LKALLIYPEFPDTFWSFKHPLKFIRKKLAYPPIGLESFDLEALDRLEAERLGHEPLGLSCSALSSQPKGSPTCLRVEDNRKDYTH